MSQDTNTDSGSNNNMYPTLSKQGLKSPQSNVTPNDDVKTQVYTNGSDADKTDEGEPQPGMSTNDEKDNDDNKKEDSKSYDMMSGVVSMGNVDCEVEMKDNQFEGQIQTPLNYESNSVPSHYGLATDDFNSNKIEQLGQLLNDAISPTFKKIITFSRPDLEKTLIDVFGILSNRQRQVVVNSFNEKYKKNVKEFVKKKCKGAFADLMLSLLMTPDEFHANWFERCLLMNDFQLFSTVLCTLSTDEVTRAVEEYNKKFPKKPLLNTIDNKTQSWFKHRNIYYVYENLLSNKKPNDSTPIDKKLIASDVQKLIDASSGFNVDKKVFIEIFTLRSHQHLANVAELYVQTNKKGNDLLKTIEASFKESSETGNALKIILLYATQRNVLLVKLLGKALQKPGPNYEILARIVIDRCEIDFATILKEYGKPAFEQWCEKEFKNNSSYSKLFHKLLN